ncbi:hypothetical protein CVIRNUC_004409 [Coccomyxa viridis]|jgi:hypothetical protein|uniref:Uncharacterized protein n=1 Tax=Coccomyxa viridis TaxID=1274662 RepID=A0AAV1I5N7_9CHLO|nr:hypothetical protein CVIRNUC_004409 [Coccomyxa viridis]
MSCVALSVGVFLLVLSLMVIIHLWIVSPMLVASFRGAQETETLAQLSQDDELARQVDLQLKADAAKGQPQTTALPSVTVATTGSLATPAEAASEFFKSSIASLAEQV